MTDVRTCAVIGWLGLLVAGCNATPDRSDEDDGLIAPDGGDNPAIAPDDAGASADDAAVGHEPLRVLAEGEDEPFALAIDDRYVYWTSGDRVRSAPLAGGPARTLATGSGLRRLVASAGFVYFTEGTAGRVTRVDREGGPVEMIGSGVYPDGIAVRDGTVYWTNAGMSAGDPGDGSIAQAMIDGAQQTLLVDKLIQPAGIALDDAFVYFTSSSQGCFASSDGPGGCYGGGISRVSRNGGTVTNLNTDGTPRELVVGARGVYWALSSPPRLMVAPVDGGAPEVLAEVLGDNPGGLALDTEALYFGSDRGRVLRLALDGGAPLPLITDLGTVGEIAVDVDWVYVAATSKGQILRVAKDGSVAVPNGPMTGPCPMPLGSAAEIALTPRSDENLELLALQLDEGALVATQATYDWVVDDVAAIRALDPDLAGIGYFPPHDGKTLALTPTEVAFQSIEAGQYSAWDCLNDFYGLESIVPSPLTITRSFVVLTLEGIYDLPQLAELYGQLPGIERAEANGFGGDGPKICAQRIARGIEYVVDNAGGDCPAGCTTHDAHHFESAAPGEIEALDTWNSEDTAEAPEWFTRVCRR